MDILKIITKSNILIETTNGDLNESIEKYGKPVLKIGNVTDFPWL